ncbi:MAG TPA: 30S ribosomal protein S8 [Thermoplasmata archaeon]|nr:30S ribosomal protein S8 [Thermoplasmata archaeon]
MLHDPLNDALVTLRHADLQGRGTVDVVPGSKLVGEVLRIFREHQYIDAFTFVANGRGGKFEVKLSRRINACGVIKPRVAVRGRLLERYEARFLPAQDFGLLVLTTNQGVMSHQDARERKIGGKLLAYVY